MDLRAFGINADQGTIAAGRGGMAQDGEQEAEHFMVKLIATEKVRAGVRRHAVELCPNVTGRTKNRMARM